MNKYEAEFSNLVKAFRKRHMGKGPREIKTTYCKQWAICEMQGNLSPVEKFIATADDGKQILREARTRMVKRYVPQPSPVEIGRFAGCEISGSVCQYRYREGFRHVDFRI